jgi:hypothetical protein
LISKKSKKKYKQKSDHELFKYCTGAIDGLAIHIQAPSKKIEIREDFSQAVKNFFLNFQGVCDANCRFNAFACKHIFVPLEWRSYLRLF